MLALSEQREYPRSYLHLAFLVKSEVLVVLVLCVIREGKVAVSRGMPDTRTGLPSRKVSYNNFARVLGGHRIRGRHSIACFLSCYITRVECLKLDFFDVRSSYYAGAYFLSAISRVHRFETLK